MNVSNEGVPTSGTQTKMIQSFIEAEGSDISENTRKMLLNLFSATTNVFGLVSIIKTMDDCNVKW